MHVLDQTSTCTCTNALPAVHSHRRDGDVRVELVDVARDEQRNLHLLSARQVILSAAKDLLLVRPQMTQMTQTEALLLFLSVSSVSSVDNLLFNSRSFAFGSG